MRSTRLRRLAATAGAELATLKRARSVCSAWPPEHRLPALSMSCHAVYCEGGPDRAPDRRAFLLDLATLHGGTLSADQVRAARGRQRCRPLADPVRSLLNRIDGAHGLLEGLPDERARNGNASPALLARRAEQCRAIADRLDQLAA